MQTRIFTGPMFSGKTRKLVIALEKLVLAKKHVLWFEPKCDTRGGSHGNYIASRMEELKNSEYVHTFQIESPDDIFKYTSEMLKRLGSIAEIFIDEYHMLDFKREFFYEYQKKDFNYIPLTFAGLIVGCDAVVLNTAREVIPFMDEIVKENAICMNCGASANYYTYIGSWSMDARIDTGKNYKCLCHDCYMKATGKPITVG